MTEHDYVDAAPLERNKTVPLESLMERAANFTITAVMKLPRWVTAFPGPERELTASEQAELTAVAGVPLKEITKQLITNAVAAS